MNEQGADTNGHCSVAGAGAVLEFMTGGGPNYAIDAGTLRLAENP